MKTDLNYVSQLFCLAFALILAGSAHAEKGPVVIPFSQIGAKATADYHGNALAVTATTTGAQLHCVFQKLVGRATTKGLWLESTAPGGGKLRLLAKAVGRGNVPASGAEGAKNDLGASDTTLADTGTISVKGNVVEFKRPGLTEEYSVSVDGLRQDFVIPKRPAGTAELWVELALTGAKDEATSYGAKLVLDGSDRALAYSRLRATDATGQQLKARLNVLSPHRLVVQVNDVHAVYPVRVDPTFSDADWIGLNSILPGTIVNTTNFNSTSINAIALDQNGDVFIGGSFTTIGTVPANNIAEWNGSTWLALDSGVYSGNPGYGNVDALAVSGTNLYAGGSFNIAGGVSANNIAEWNGNMWTVLGSGVTGSFNGSGPYVLALAVTGNNLSGTALYVGGAFTNAGGVFATNIARWNGYAWSPLGAGVNGQVEALTASPAYLYVGGAFTNAGSIFATNIAEWDGSAWSALGTGVSSSTNYSIYHGFPNVDALAFDGSTLYAAGNFTDAGGVAATNIASWGGSAWAALGAGLANQAVRALASSGTNLYAENYNGEIDAWNGNTWSNFAYGAYLLAANGTNVYYGARFNTGGVGAAYYIEESDGNSSSVLGASGAAFVVSGPVSSLLVDGTNLYAGKPFNSSGTISNFVVRWDGNTWSTVGPPMNGSGGNGGIYALAVGGGEWARYLYAGGQFNFNSLSTSSAENIAKWDGNAWLALGSGGGPSGPVIALAASGPNLYVGGEFSYISTNNGPIMPAANIAVWNGSTWSALGSGINGPVYALAVTETNLYVGGQFTSAGGVSATNIARWDGTQWSALGSGINSPVYTLAVIGNKLYAGGQFYIPGVVPIQNIAEWDGDTWLSVGPNNGQQPNGPVTALATSGTNLYVGGDFNFTIYTPTNRIQVNNIAKWDGSSWSALGSGVQGDYFYPPYNIQTVVKTLAADTSGHLFVGGSFMTAGTNVSPFIAEANLGLPVSLLGDANGDGIVDQSELDTVLRNYFQTSPPNMQTVMAPSNTVFQFGLNNLSGLNFQVLASSSLSLPLSQWQDIGTATLSYQFTDPYATNYSQRFYQLVWP